VNSAPVDRTIRVLDFLTTHPGQAFLHSELSRRIGISKATAHAILSSLTAAGYVVRDSETRQYSPGPALVPLGSVALRSLPAVTAATEQARLLADELDVQCVVMWSTADEMVILAHAGIPRVSGFAGQAGQRLPLIPPLGTAQMAWADDGKVAGWLDRLGQISPEARQPYVETLEQVRRRGNAVGYSVDAYQRLSQLYEAAADDVRSPEVAAQLQTTLAELGRDHYLEDGSERELRPTFLSTPIFDRDGRMALALSLLLDDRFTTDDVPRFVKPLIRAATSVTQSIDGRRPDVSARSSR
jgi:DNA-binding IclR family transcriptional regulator